MLPIAGRGDGGPESWCDRPEATGQERRARPSLAPETMALSTPGVRKSPGLCPFRVGLGSRRKAPIRSHSKRLNLNAESLRAASYPSGPIHLFAAGLGRPALTGEGGSSEARGSGGEGGCVPRGQLSTAWIMWRRHTTPTYVFLFVWGGFWPWRVGSSPVRDQTRAPCMGNAL